MALFNVALHAKEKGRAITLGSPTLQFSTTVEEIFLQLSIISLAGLWELGTLGVNGEL
jgi:hypothetical protein